MLLEGVSLLVDVDVGLALPVCVPLPLHVVEGDAVADAVWDGEAVRPLVWLDVPPDYLI